MKNVLFAAVIVASSTVLAEAQSPKQGGEIRIALPADITSSEPGVRRSSDSDTVLHHVVEALVAYREDLTVAPMLAESYSLDDKGLAYTFKLRRNIKFHNGAALTSADVVWSWNRMLDPATKWQCRNWYDGSQGTKITAIEAPDEQTVVFRLATPSALFLRYMADIQCITGILHKDSLTPGGEWNAPIGTGPFSFVEWRKGAFILLKRFQDYAPVNGEPSGFAGARIAHADLVRWMVIPDKATRKAALLAGQIDLASIDVSDMADLRSNATIRLQTTIGLSWNVLLIQTRDPLLSDVRVRRALAHAIDTTRLVEARTEGLGQPNASAVPRSSAAHTPAHDAGYKYDPDLARKLLKEAGYDGRVIKLQANQRLAYLYDTAILLQAMLKEVGFNVELEILEWATQLDRFNKGNFQLQSFRFSARLEPSLNYRTFTGSKDKDASNQWDDPEAVALLGSASAEVEPSRRQEIFDWLHRRMIEQVPIISLYNTLLVDASTTRITGFAPTSLGKARAWGVWVAK